MKEKIAYEEISRAKVSKSRNVVISACSKGGFTIAQQLEAIEDGKSTFIFLKGAIHVDDLDKMYDLRDALNAAIENQEKTIEEKWD